MLIKLSHSIPIQSSEITPEGFYAGRRRFLKETAGAAISIGTSHAWAAEAALAPLTASRKLEMAGGEGLTPHETITHYNNFYEFGTDEDDPARNAGRLRTRPWSVVIDGECEAPQRIDVDELLNPRVLEERIYRHRCVEAWSFVAPWMGVPLGEFLMRFKPTSKAKFVAFYTQEIGGLPEAGKSLAGILAPLSWRCRRKAVDTDMFKVGAYASVSTPLYAIRGEASSIPVN